MAAMEGVIATQDRPPARNHVSPGSEHHADSYHGASSQHASNGSLPGAASSTSSAAPTASPHVHQQHALSQTQLSSAQAAMPAQVPRPLAPRPPNGVAHTPAAPTPPMKFGSPDSASTSTQAPRDLQSAEHYSVLANGVDKADAAVVRQILRDHWDKCLIGSDYHVSFVLNATLHQASPATLSRAVQDFGAKLVQTSKPEILRHFTAADYDQMADVILSNASPRFLDRALAQRLETIDARSLVNSLARAERLGYDVRDIVEERSNDQPEHVIPSLQGAMPPRRNYSSPAPADAHALVQPPPQQWAQPAQPGAVQGVLAPPGRSSPPRPQFPQEAPPTKGPAGVRYCSDCGRPCSGNFALQYHLKKKACSPSFSMNRVGKSICPHCGCSFGSYTGVMYHVKSEVCGQYSKETTDALFNELQRYSQKQQQQQQQEEVEEAYAAAAAQPYAPHYQNNYPHQPREAHQSQPATRTTPAKPSPGGRQNGAAPNGGDAYAHLTTEARKKFADEVAKTEQKYGALMRDAMQLSEPERSEKLSRIKNSYNTKQSTTRKRYGIRLTERRTQEDIDEERRRLLGPNGAKLWLEHERAAREQQRAKTQTESQTKPADDSPRKRVPLSEMGGLSGSAGSAETTDPTAFLTSSQPRGLAQLHRSQADAQASGTADNPMTIDKDDSQPRSEPQEQNQDGSDDSSSSSDDEGIPAN